MTSIRALVVDDNEINQMIMTKFLENLNLHADTASNGLEAVQSCEAHKYDVIFMDIEMPVMNGHEAVSKIRQDLKYYNPIIALTAHEKDSIIKRLRKEGFSGYLKKPLSEKELSLKIYSESPLVH